MSKRRNRNRIDGQFAPRLIEMLESPTYRTLSLSGRRVLDCIEIELAQHAGKDNGKLPVTFRDFHRYGMHWASIAPGIQEVVSLGLVRITRAGQAGNAAFRLPTLFRLTYRHSDHEEASHEWRRISTMQQAKELVRKMQPQKPQKLNSKNRSSTALKTRAQPRSKKWSTVPASENRALFIFRGGDLPGGRLSAEPAGTVRTTRTGRGLDAVDVVHNDDRCFGFLRRLGSSYQAWWSDEEFDDHLIGEFESEAAAIAAVVEAAARSDGSATASR
jgi:hypothetical protein